MILVIETNGAATAVSPHGPLSFPLLKQTEIHPVCMCSSPEPDCSCEYLGYVTWL
jgi:hypothetical protein